MVIACTIIHEAQVILCMWCYLNTTIEHPGRTHPLYIHPISKKISTGTLDIYRCIMFLKKNIAVYSMYSNLVLNKFNCVPEMWIKFGQTSRAVL